MTMKIIMHSVRILRLLNLVQNKMTSTAFVAYLPVSITDDQLTRYVQWMKNTCIRSDFLWLSDGRVKTICVKSEPKSLRTFQRNVRTNLINWGVALPALQPGWLTLIEENDFDKERNNSPDNDDSVLAPLNEKEPRVEAKDIYTSYASPARFHLPRSLLSAVVVA
jgi:hypothetical protein